MLKGIKGAVCAKGRTTKMVSSGRWIGSQGSIGVILSRVQKPTTIEISEGAE